jgi:hypothetical protein
MTVKTPIAKIDNKTEAAAAVLINSPAPVIVPIPSMMKLKAVRLLFNPPLLSSSCCKIMSKVFFLNNSAIEPMG